MSLVNPNPDSLCFAYASRSPTEASTRVRFGRGSDWSTETILDSTQALECRLMQSPGGTLYALLLPSMVLFRLRGDGSIANMSWLGFAGLDRVRDADARFVSEDTIFVAYRIGLAAEEVLFAAWSPTGAMFDSSWIDIASPDLDMVGLVEENGHILVVCAGIPGVATYASSDRHHWSESRLDLAGTTEVEVGSKFVLLANNANLKMYPVSDGLGSPSSLSLTPSFASGPFVHGSFAACITESVRGSVVYFTFGQGYDSTGSWTTWDSRFVVSHITFTMDGKDRIVAPRTRRVDLPRTESATAVAMAPYALAVASSDDYLKVGKIRFYRMP